MDEDVLQALLTHWIGTHRAVRMKAILINTRRMPRIWKQSARVPDSEASKYRYYFDDCTYSNMMNVSNLAHERRKTYESTFFMSPLPGRFFEEAGGYDDDDESIEDDSKKSPKEIKQLLLRTLATEVVVRRALDGEVAVVQSDFQWFATGIAHTTLFAVMRFMGFQEEWISFFKKVLKPPLDMLDGSGVRVRKRGLPMAHIFEKLFGELVLFFMDLAVAQQDGMILYRFHDDLWLAGKPAQCAAAWSSMVDFAKVLRLEFNKHKTGSVYLTDYKHTRDSNIVKSLPHGDVAMNFLVLNRDTGTWTINQQHVQEHVQQLRRQLDQSKSVLQWIKTWNSCIGRFFSYTFGEPAHCFGMDHILGILETHKNIQTLLFHDSNPPGTVTQHIRQMIMDHFNVEEVPDSFLAVPETLRGLGLKNPFIPLLLLRPNVCSDPEARMLKFQEDEKRQYENAKKDFESLSEREKKKRYTAAFKSDIDEDIKPAISWNEAQTFISFEDFTKHRELISNKLYDVYTYFLKQPDTVPVKSTIRIKDELKKVKWLTMNGDSSKEADAETLWTIQFLEDELLDLYGGLEVTDRGLLPLGVLKALKARKVTWQMVL